METAATERLNSQTLFEARIAVFVDRDATLDEVGSEYTLAELKETLLFTWEDIRQEIETLPEKSFDRQPDDVDGNDVWSAGQVISHLCDTELRSQRFWEQLFGVETIDPPIALFDYSDVKLLSREDSMRAIIVLDGMVALLIDRVDGANDLSRTATHEAFGTTALKGALLITCIHLDDHLEQLREMRCF